MKKGHVKAKGRSRCLIWPSILAKTEVELLTCLVYQTSVHNSQVVAQQGIWNYNKNSNNLTEVTTILYHKSTLSPLLQKELSNVSKSYSTHDSSPRQLPSTVFIFASFFPSTFRNFIMEYIPIMGLCLEP